MMVGLRLALMTILGRDRLLYSFLNPFSWMVAFAIACGSIFKNRGKGAEWKGRVYPQLGQRYKQKEGESAVKRETMLVMPSDFGG